MITFTGTDKIKLTSDRKQPDKYDLMWWGPCPSKFARYVAMNICDVDFAVYNGHKIEPPYPVGFKYHIMTYPKFYTAKSDAICIEKFEACLVNPLDYAETIVSQNFGVIGKVSDKSAELFESMYKHLRLHGNLMQLFKGVEFE